MSMAACGLSGTGTGVLDRSQGLDPQLDSHLGADHRSATGEQSGREEDHHPRVAGAKTLGVVPG